ncbi:right-handed parallel beta-helix repeat-containing protein [Verrucomicrobiaceae bacterium 227]
MSYRSFLSTFLLLLFLNSPAHGQKLAEADYAHPSYRDRFLREATVSPPSPTTVIHVNPVPDDQKNSVTSLTAARDLARTIRKQGHPAGGIEIKIAPGTYHLDSSLVLTSADSGTAESPTLWNGTAPGQVTLSGGTELDASQLKPVTEAALLARLHPSAKGQVHSLALPTIAPDLFSDRGRPGLLAMNGHMLRVAQWPNVGYHHIDKVLDSGPTTRWLKPGEERPIGTPEKPIGATFTFRESLSPAVEEEFQRTGRIRLEGYPSNDWYFQNEDIGKIENGIVQLQNATRYGVKDHIKSLPRRVRLVNVLAELDQPGEWYFDRDLKRLFLWPIPGSDPARASLTIPGGKPLISLQGTSHHTFQNLILENTGDEALQIRNGRHNLIAGCTIRNGLRRGLTISGGFANGITGCDFHDLHQAFSLSGGDFRTLERCYHFATNNRIHDCRLRGYGMIGLSGVGIYFAHNLLHDMNGAISFNTTDLLMECNEFYNIGYEMGDFNVAYCGAQWHSMHNVLRYNFVHHILEPGGHPVCPFRNDDGGAGLKIFGNVFYRAGRCAAQFHGPANTLQNNISLKAPVFWWTLKRPITPEAIREEWDALARFGHDLPQGDKGDFKFNLARKIGKEAWLKSPWIEQYPEVAAFIKTDPFAQTFCHIEQNYATPTREPFHIHGGDGTVEGMEDQRTGKFADLPAEGTFDLPAPISLESFRDLPSLDLRFKESFQPMPGFHPIPFQEIGLQKTAYRPHIPDKKTYRSATYQKFQSDTKRGYHPKTVNARYPVPEYLQ